MLICAGKSEGVCSFVLGSAENLLLKKGPVAGSAPARGWVGDRRLELSGHIGCVGAACAGVRPGLYV
jgi:hypothetical protein